MKMIETNYSRNLLKTKTQEDDISFEVVETLSEEQVEDLYLMYQEEWWTKGRKRNDIKRMLEFSNVFVAFCHPETHQLIAFARVLSDYVYKALVLDVIVREPYRRKSLGLSLMKRIFHHPKLKEVEHFELYCLPKHIPFYKKLGFSEDLGEICFLRKEAD